MYDGIAQWSPFAEGSLRLTNSAYQQGRPDIVATDNEVVAVWQENQGNQSTGSVVAQRVTPQGHRQWSTLGLPITSENGDTPRVVSCEDGTYIFVCREYTTMGSVVIAKRYTSGGVELWQSSVQMSSVSPALFLQDVVPDGAGGIVAIWTTLDRKLWAQRTSILGDNIWESGGQLISQLPQYVRLTVSPDGVGGAYIIVDNYVTQQTLSDRRSYVYHVDEAGTANLGSEGMQVSNVSSNHCLAVSVADGNGGAFLLWHDGRTSNTLGWDTYAQHIDSAGNRLWGEEDLQITSGTGKIGSYPSGISPSIATDGFGGALVAWGDCRNGPAADIYVQRLTPDGSVLWQSGGVPVTSATQIIDTNMLRVVSDGTGGAIVTWKTGNGNVIPQKILAQHLAADGLPTWNPQGVIVANTQGNRYALDADLISDNAGGAYMAWRGGTISDYNLVGYITRIYANGTLAPAAGLDEWKQYSN